MKRFLALFLLGALLLAGCTVAPKVEDLVVPEGTVRVVVLGGPGLENALTSAFAPIYPQVKVESATLPEGDFTQLVEKLRSGEAGVDVIVAPANTFLFAEGVIMPLDDMIKKVRLDLKPYGETLSLGKYKEKLYGLPASVSPMTVIYNKDLFAAAGLKEPTAGWTWADFEVAARGLAKAQAGKEKAWGAVIPPWAYADVFLTTGKGPADPDLVTLESTLVRYHQLTNIDKALQVEAIGANDADYYQAFGRGEIGMMINYWGTSFGHAPPKFAWGVAPLPGAKEVPGIATLAMVTAKAQNPEAAFAFASFAAGPKGVQALVHMPGAPVPGFVDEIVQGLWITQASVTAENAGFMLKQRYVPTPEYPAEMVPLLLKELQAVIQNQKTPDQAIAAYKQAREPFMSKK